MNSKTREQRKSKISVDSKIRFSNNRRFSVNKETSKKFLVSKKLQSNFLGSRKFSKFSRKSQIQMMETIAVLFVFFILIVLGLVFYAKVLKGNIELQKEESVQLNAIEVAQRASSLPELQCSEDNIISDNCIDLIKLEAASDIISENEIYYYDRLLFSTIKVRDIYPDENEWTLYERPLEDFSNKITTNIPISLFNPIENNNAFGIMTVELFLK